jgi:tRNA(Ser,Leu) C12 N-acetylase TAN1
VHRWNLIVTVVPGLHHIHDVRSSLGHLGHFWLTSFRDVLIGWSDDTQTLLQTIADAREKDKRWSHMVGRVIPVQNVFYFTVDSLTGQLKEAVAPLVEEMQTGRFYFRLERRGMAGQIPSQDVEQAVAAHLVSLAHKKGIELTTDFEDPDFVVAAETIGTECGVCLLTRELMTRFPFVRPK